MLPPKLWKFINDIKGVQLSASDVLEYFDDTIGDIIPRIVDKPNNGKFITHLNLRFLYRDKVIYDDGTPMTNPEDLRVSIDEPFIQHLNEALKVTKYRVTHFTLHNDIMKIFFNKSNKVLQQNDQRSMAFGSSILPSGYFKYNKVV